MRAPPAYCIHRGRNLAYVTLNGREHYLGRAHSPESHARYREMLAAHLAGERPAPSPRTAAPAFTVAELAERWYLAVRDRYGPRHQATYEARYAASELVRAHATARVHEFGPRAFKAIRDRLVRDGRTRQWANRMMNAIRRCIRWGVGEELVPADRIEALAAVDGLRRGSAPERAPRGAADPAAVDAVVRRLESEGNRGAAALVRFLRATGCRPGEACRARWEEFDIGADLPHYRPARHKTAGHGIERLVPLNADALAAIGAPMRVGGGFVFLNTRGVPFTPNSLLLAVRRAIAAEGCAAWSPYELRHLAATVALARTGSEAAAAALLGHTPRSTIIQRYSRDRLALAARAAKAIEEVA
ncbi:MAG: tyrosine-type recombinase/integrase [Phycisphaerales bacterium]